jgi:hypothetical protein
MLFYQRQRHYFPLHVVLRIVKRIFPKLEEQKVKLNPLISLYLNGVLKFSESQLSHVELKPELCVKLLSRAYLRLQIFS